MMIHPEGYVHDNDIDARVQEQLDGVNSLFTEIFNKLSALEETNKQRNTLLEKLIEVEAHRNKQLDNINVNLKYIQ